MLRILFTFGCFFLLFSAAAQDKTGDYKAAEELVTAMRLEANFKTTMNAAIAAQANAIPENQRPQFLAAMREFLEKYATWDKMKEAYIAIYREEFTENELKEIAQFYRSPAGMKYVEKSSVLASKGVQFGQKLVTDHPKEMQEILKKHFNGQ